MTYKYSFSLRWLLVFLTLSLVLSKKGSRSSKNPKSKTYNPLMLQTLVAVTTCNHWDDITKPFLDSFVGLRHQPELIVVDDASTDGTVQKARALGFTVLESDKPQGLTASFNRVYNHWKTQTKYKYLFITNNDVLIPNGALVRMARALKKKDVYFVGPLTTKQGLGMSHEKYQHQRIDSYYDDISRKVLKKLPAATQKVQNSIIKMSKTYRDTTLKVFGILGFFMGMDRGVERHEFQPNTLFDPSKINLGQEWDLERRGVQMHVVLDAFVFHAKGSTLAEALGPKRDNLAAAHPELEQQ